MSLPELGRRSPRKRQAILAAAVRGFLEDGYSGTSLDSVAAEAGVGKQTVYSHFGNKEQLFLAALAEARRARPENGETVELDVHDPTAGLTALAGQVVAAVTDPVLAALRRLTICELPHHRGLQDLWRQSTSPSGYGGLVAFLAACHEAGTLVVPDPELSGRQLAYLLATDARTTTAQGIRPLEDAERQRIIAEAVGLILRAHTPVDRPTPALGS
jgi:TetR/AcrR family transcriptional repressor of mexJK operon